MTKVTKIQAVYFPTHWVDDSGVGTACGKCRDFIQLSSECIIVEPAQVSGPRGTCTQYIHGKPHAYGQPLRLIPKSLVGYVEGKGVPTYCGHCKAYENVGARNSTCALVGDYDTDEVQYGGCCNLYTSR